MAELAILVASETGALGTGAAAAANAATLGNVLNVGLTAAATVGAIREGQAVAQGMTLQARQNEINANLEKLRGRKTALQIQDQLRLDLASQNALFAARGGLAGEGSAGAAREMAQDVASQNIDTARFDAEVAALNSEQRAANLRADAGAARASGQIRAVQNVAAFRRFQVPGRNNPSLYGG